MNEPNIIKKNDKFMDKQRKYLVLAVFMVVTLFIGSSYALLTNFDTTDEVINIKTGNLSVTVNNTDTLVNHELNGKLPESDADGLANATPITLTITNNGTLNIMKYEVKLVKNTSQTSTLDYNCIKYAISLDNGVTYNTPENLGTSNNIIYTGYNLNVEASKTITLKLWIDEAAGNNALGKTFYGSIDVMLYQKAELPGSYKVLDVANSIPNCTRTVTDTDGTVYISGNSDNPSIYANAETDNCVIDFNYVWWSGKMWRITAIYPDGAMKLVTDNNITSIAFNEENNVTYYDKTNGTKSYMFQWLNEDFLDTLYNQGRDVIDTTKSWNATMPADTNITTKPLETDATMIPTTTSPIGLLNSYEYYKSYQNTIYGRGYLNIGYYWWLLNPYSSSDVWSVNNRGNGINLIPTNARGGRPSIYLKSGISLSGSGTKESPYRLSYDYDETNTDDKIYTRHSGEYVKLSNNGIEQLFRIVDVEDNKTKIVAMDYADNKAKRKFATNSSDGLWGSGTTTGTDTWYTYLNGTYYPNLVSTYGELFDSATYYLGTTSTNYKLSVCANTTSGNTKVCDKTTQTGTFNIGLLRYGEMFATQQGSGYSNSNIMWLMNRYSASYVWYVSNDGSGSYNSPASARGGRPSIHLKSAVKILSGSGTELDPYVVGL